MVDLKRGREAHGLPSVGLEGAEIMSLHESDREDLFAECTALVRRIELAVPGEVEPVVAGCRATGAWSIYFGGDPAYHFDEEGRLRRAFAGGLLYRTQGDTLARLERRRTDGEVVLARSDLGVIELEEFMGRVLVHVRRLQDSLQSGTATCGRRFPEDFDVAALLTDAVRRVLVAWPKLSPAIATRRG